MLSTGETAEIYGISRRMAEDAYRCILHRCMSYYAVGKTMFIRKAPEESLLGLFSSISEKNEKGGRNDGFIDRDALQSLVRAL